MTMQRSIDRRIRHRAASTLAVALLSTLLVAGCGGGDGDGPSDPPSDTPAARTAAGWDDFEAGRWDDAVVEFEAALALDGAYGPARVGLGWARLQQATSPSAMLAAAGEFDAAVAAGETGAEVYAGRAAARLGAGGTSLAGAVSDAQAALAADATFTFAHRATFGVPDLHLIIAFARAAQNDLAGALAAADAVIDSGIVEGAPATWVVDGTAYPTFAGALLAHLHALAEDHAG
jgi:hypothetical protein